MRVTRGAVGLEGLQGRFGECWSILWQWRRLLEKETPMCWGIEGQELPKARDTPAPGEGNLVGLLHRMRHIDPQAFWFPPEQHWDLVDQSPTSVKPSNAPLHL